MRQSGKNKVHPNRTQMTIKYRAEKMRLACEITKIGIQTHITSDNEANAAYCYAYTACLYIDKIQQDATVCRYLFTAKSHFTCFGCPSHPSSAEHKTVTAASGTGHSN